MTKSTNPFWSATLPWRVTRPNRAVRRNRGGRVRRVRKPSPCYFLACRGHFSIQRSSPTRTARINKLQAFGQRAPARVYGRSCGALMRSNLHLSMRTRTDRLSRHGLMLNTEDDYEDALRERRWRARGAVGRFLTHPWALHGRTCARARSGARARARACLCARAMPQARRGHAAYL